MAMGRRLLSFFFPATSRAPQKKGLTCAGTFPAPIAFTARVKAPKALLASAAEVFFKTDLKCSGRMPEGPAPEPFGKDSAAVATSAVLKALGGMTLVGGGGWGRLGAGCFRCISDKAAGENSARPCDTKDCTALEYCPSWALDLHRLALHSSKVGCSISTVFFFLPLVTFWSNPVLASAQSCPHSPACQRLNLSLMILTCDQ